jgi:hypothetical protein
LEWKFGHLWGKEVQARFQGMKLRILIFFNNMGWVRRRVILFFVYRGRKALRFQNGRAALMVQNATLGFQAFRAVR